MEMGLGINEITQIETHLPYLSYDQDGALTCSGVRVSKLVEQHGTPLLLYNEGRLLSNYYSLQRSFAEYFSSVRICFAEKSCYLPACLHSLRVAGAHVEVMSDLELQIALINGFTPQQVVTNGIGRSTSYLERSTTLQTRLNIIDGMEDLLRLQAVAASRGMVVEIGLRVNPPSQDKSLMIGQSSKLGMDWNDGDIIAILRAALAMSEVRVSAILVHRLSHCQSVEQFGDVMAGAAKIITTIYEQTGHAFDIVDIGGGLDTRYLIERQGITTRDFAREARKHLSAVPYTFTLQLEPGRYIVADAAIGVTRVMAEKQNTAVNWRVCDMSSNILIPLADISYYPIPSHLPADGQWRRFHVGDATLAPSYFCKDAILPAGTEGRELVLLNCGGYTSVFAELWAFRLPTILYQREDGLHELFGVHQFVQLVRDMYGYEVQA